MKIIDRYILKEHAGPLVFALTALTSLLLLNYIAKRFGQLVGKGLPWSVIGEFFVLSLPFTVAMTLPMAVLVATLYAFSRLAAEAEITAFKASGVSTRRLMAPVLLAGVVLAGGMVWFNDQVLPWSNHRLSLLQSDIARKKPTFLLREQIINEVVPGQLFLRFGRMDQTRDMMYEVVIYDLSSPERRRTITADSGIMHLTEDQTDAVMTLYDGLMQETTRAEPLQLQRLYFDHNRITVRGVGNQLERSESGGVKSDREMTVCEMHARREAAAADYERARRRMGALAAAARRAGDTTTIEIPARSLRSDRLGATYCNATRALAAALRGEGGGEGGDSAAPARRDPVTSELADRGQGVPVPVLAESARRLPERARRVVEDDTTVSIAPSAGGVTGQKEMLRLELERQRQLADAYGVEIHKKFALAAAIVVFVLLGAPIALRFPRGGVGLVIGVSLAVFGLYYMCLIAGETVADKGCLPPAIAMWAANAVFSTVGLVMLARMGRESGSARGGDLGELLDTLRLTAARVLHRVGIRVERRRVA